jgi:hypothetical protein
MSVFGKDIENWQPATSQLVDVHAFGYPVEKLNDVPAGDLICIQSTHAITKK